MHEDDLWEELEEEVNPVTEVDAVECFEENTHDHLSDTSYDCHFHLVGVHEGQLI